MITSSHFLLLLLIATTFVSSTASPPTQHADRIIEAMIGAGDFRDWAADFLSAVDDQFGIPLSATIFVPANFDAADVSSSGSVNSSRLSVAYHIVPQRLSFTDLRILEPLSRLPTLLPGNSIVVTNNSISGFALDGVLVSEPDLFMSSSIAIHGVASALDFSLYGDGENGDTALADSLHPLSQRRRRHRYRYQPNINEPSDSEFTGKFSIGSFLLPLALVLI